jgi:hypothetical protein
MQVYVIVLEWNVFHKPVMDPQLFSFTLRHEHLFLFMAYVLGSLVLTDISTSVDFPVLLNLSSTRISCQQSRIIESVLARPRAAVCEHILIHAYNLM